MVDLQFNYPILPGQVETFAESLRAVAGKAAEVIKLPPYGGAPEMRSVASEWLSLPGYPVPPERVLLSGGGHNAVMAAMLATGLVGRKIACDPFTYNGFKKQAGLLGSPLIVCEGDEQGMLPDTLDRAAMEHGVAAVYLMPTIHNPLGTVMPMGRRLEIVEVARRHGLLIVDDDAYRFLVADAPPHFAALAPELGVFVYSFTKPFAPGLKVAFFTFPKKYDGAMIDALRVTASGAPRVFCEMAASLIGSGEINNILEAKRKEGAARQKLARQLLEGLPVRGHDSAYHVWVELPEGVSSDEVASALERRGIAISSGASYKVSPKARDGVRIALGAERDLNVLRTALETVRDEVLTIAAVR